MAGQRLVLLPLLQEGVPEPVSALVLWLMEPREVALLGQLAVRRVVAVRPVLQAPSTAEPARGRSVAMALARSTARVVVVPPAASRPRA